MKKYNFYSPLFLNLFLFFTFVAFNVLLVFGYFSYMQIFDNYKESLQSINQNVVSTIKARLKAQESILKVMSDRLIELNALHHPENGFDLLKSLNYINPNLASYGLSRVDGQLLVVSGTTQKKLPNLLESNATSATFISTLLNKNITIGHAYYFKLLNKWVLPLRYTMRDKVGNPVFVMTLGYDVQQNDTLFPHEDIIKEMDVAVVTEDMFVVERTMEHFTPEKYYKEAVPKRITNQFDLELIQKNRTHFQFFTNPHGQTMVAAITYIKDYHIYVLNGLQYRMILITFLPYIGLYLGLFFILTIFFFYLFRYVDRTEYELNEKLKFQLYHDDLTGLHNRIALNDFLKTISSKYDEKPMALILVDLDHFKRLNDLYSHEIGDKILQECAARLQLTFSKELFLSRIGSDQFVIVVESTNNDLGRVSTLIHEVMSQPFKLEYTTIQITAKIAIIRFPEEANDIATLMAYADLMLEKAKHDQDSIAHFDHSYIDDFQRKALIEAEFKHALQNDQFYIAYQPQMDVDTHVLKGVEALVRWNNPTLGSVSPSEFIPISEEGGFIIPLGKYIFEKAIAETITIWEHCDNKYRLSINVSVRQLLENAFVEDILAIVKQYSFPPEFLVVEITESVMIADTKIVIEKLALLREYSIGISLDDFGTGFSSLSMISSLPISELKIDQSFVFQMTNSLEKKNLTMLIISMGKTLGLEIVAEGVETLEHAQLLKEFGSDILQGYYFSKPLSKVQLINFIAP